VRYSAFKFNLRCYTQVATLGGNLIKIEKTVDGNLLVVGLFTLNPQP